MPPKKHSISKLGFKNCQGFMLLEVLVAMSMILGVWMSSVGIYQRIALNLVQQEAKRSRLRKDSDAFEVQEHSRAHFNIPSKSLSHESARVSSRNRAVRTSTQSIIKDKR